MKIKEDVGSERENDERYGALTQKALTCIIVVILPSLSEVAIISSLIQCGYFSLILIN